MATHFGSKITTFGALGYSRIFPQGVFLGKRGSGDKKESYGDQKRVMVTKRMGFDKNTTFRGLGHSRRGFCFLKKDGSETKYKHLSLGICPQGLSSLKNGKVVLR